MDKKAIFDPLRAIYEDRARMGVGLRLLQRIMTGLPDVDSPMPKSNPFRELARDLLLLVGFSAGAGLFAALGLRGGFASTLLLASLWLSLGATGRLRKLTVGHKHEGAHGVGFDGMRAAGYSRAFIRTCRFTIVEFCAVVALATPGIRYMRDHGPHHERGKLGTARDPDGAFLLAEGFRRGLPKGAFTRQLLGCVANPLWYLRKLGDRLTYGKQDRFILARTGRVIMFGALVSPLAFLPLPIWFAAIGFPWFIGFPAASLLQVITEHPYVDRQGASNFEGYVERTWDRIPWDIMPSASFTTRNGWRAWVRWTLRFLLVHLPSRLALLDKTMIWHRYHHIAWPLGRAFDDWWNIHFYVVEAWQDGALPAGWEVGTLSGLFGALARQKVHMESDESCAREGNTLSL